MNTVLSNTRNSNLYLIGAVAIITVVLLTIANIRPLSNVAGSPSTSKPTSPLSSPAFFEYRRGEWSPGAAASSIGSAAFYEYRQGEWSINLNADREASNSELRQGERNANLSPDLRDFANYLHRQGEWSGK